MEAGQGDELELVAHRREFGLESGNGRVVEVLLPVETRRAVVGQHLARIFRMDRFGETARVIQSGLAGLAPDQIGIWRIGQAAANRLLDTWFGLVKPLDGAFASQERLIVGVDIRSQQIGRFRVGARNNQRRHTHHVSG